MNVKKYSGGRGNPNSSPLHNNHPSAGVKSGGNRSISPTFIQLGANSRRQPDFFTKLSRMDTCGKACPYAFFIYGNSERQGGEIAEDWYIRWDKETSGKRKSPYPKRSLHFSHIAYIGFRLKKNGIGHGTGEGALIFYKM